MIAYMYLLITMIFFGTAFASSEEVVHSMPHQIAADLRFGGGAIILAVILLVSQIRSRGIHLGRRQLMKAVGVGLIGVFAYNVFFFWGLSLAPSADGSVIVPVLSPVFTNMALLAVGQIKPAGWRIAGLVIGLAGAAVFLIGADAGGGGGVRVEGDLIYLLGAVAWAAYSIASKKMLHGIDSLRATTYGTAAGAIGLLLFSIPNVTDVRWTSLPSITWLNVVYLAIGPTAIAYLFYFKGLRNVSPANATMVMFTVPIFGVASSMVFLGESFTVMQILGGFVMLGGAVLAVVSFRSPAKTELGSLSDPEPGQLPGPGASDTVPDSAVG